MKNVSEVWEVLRTGSNGRAVGSTNANEHSSRSHWFVFLSPNAITLSSLFLLSENITTMVNMMCFLKTACIV